MSSPVVIAVRCQHCGKQLPPSDVNFSPGGVIICQQCTVRDKESMQVLMGNLPPTCQECHCDLSGRRAHIVRKDGVMQILCPTCGPAYVAKRRDMFGPTEYGHRLKLKG